MLRSLAIFSFPLPFLTFLLPSARSSPAIPPKHPCQGLHMPLRLPCPVHPLLSRPSKQTIVLPSPGAAQTNLPLLPHRQPRLSLPCWPRNAMHPTLQFYSAPRSNDCSLLFFPPLSPASLCALALHWSPLQCQQPPCLPLEAFPTLVFPQC